MAQLRLGRVRGERRRSTGTWDAANATCFTIPTAATYSGFSFLNAPTESFPSGKFKNDHLTGTHTHTYFKPSVKAITYGLNIPRAVYELIHHILLAHIMGQNGTTQKKSLGKLSSIFGNFPCMAAAWSTSALRQILFLYVVYIFGEFLTKLFGFSLHHHKNFSLSKLSPFDPIHGVLYTKSWATMQLVSSSTRV